VISADSFVTIGAGLMIGTRQSNIAAKFVDGGGDAQVVGGDDDVGENPGHGHAAVDVLDHRTAVEIGERLAGEPGRSVSGGDDGDDGERKNRRIDSGTSRYRVHDE